MIGAVAVAATATLAGLPTEPAARPLLPSPVAPDPGRPRVSPAGVPVSIATSQPVSATAVPRPSSSGRPKPSSATPVRMPASPAATSRAVPTSAAPGVTVLPVRRESEFRSLGADQSTEIDFVNRRDEPVVIHWLDYHGARERYAVLGSGEKRQQQTFVSHPWVVTDMHGRALTIFLPATGPALAAIT